MRFIVYFLIFIYFANSYDSFFIGLIAAIGASILWNSFKARQNAERPTNKGSWEDIFKGGGASSTSGRASSYDFGKGHIRSAIFPNEVFTPISFYVASLFSCLGRIAKAKGVVREKDIELANEVMNRLRLPIHYVLRRESILIRVKTRIFPSMYWLMKLKSNLLPFLIFSACFLIFA